MDALAIALRRVDQVATELTDVHEALCAEAAHVQTLAIATPSPPPPEYCITTAYILNLREEPETSASIIKWIEEATALEIKSEQGEWYEVTTPTGADGYVHANYCKKESNP